MAETRYTAFTPQGRSGSDAKQPAGKGAAAALLPAPVHELGSPASTSKKGGKKDGGGTDDALVPLKEPGKPVTTTVDTADAPALVGSADGRWRPAGPCSRPPRSTAGAGRGLLGISCSAPDTDFWFPGASTAEDRQDYVHLTNPDDTGAVVDLELYGKDGLIKTSTGEGITVPPHSTVPVLLSTLTSEAAHEPDRPRRRAQPAGSARRCRPWTRSWAPTGCPPSADPRAGRGDARHPRRRPTVRLVVFAPGDRRRGPEGVRSPRPTGTDHPGRTRDTARQGGMTTAVDLKDLTKGEAGSLVLTPADGIVHGPRGRGAPRHPRQGRRAGDGVHPGHAAHPAARHRRRQPRRASTLSLTAPAPRPRCG